MYGPAGAGSVTLTTYADGREALRHRELRAATHDEAAFLLGETILVLHGDEHTHRRRVQNRLFRRDTLARYEREALPVIFDEALAPFLARDSVDLVELSHRLVVLLSAAIAGVDRPERTVAEADRLYGLLKAFSEGATIIHTTRDRDEVRRDTLAALGRFEQEFLLPSVERRRALLDRVARGEIGEDELPSDLLTTLLAQQAELEMDEALLTREMALSLIGAHTAANQITHLVHELAAWSAEHPEEGDRPFVDLPFIQRAMHESVRLNPPSPVLVRKAPPHPVTLRTGAEIPADVTVVVELNAANRTTGVFGQDAEAFNPFRTIGRDAFPWGLSFGAGAHACIGQEMAAGQVRGLDTTAGDPLFGVVPRVVHALFARGMRPDPARPPARATHTTRREWGSYPVTFAAAVGAVAGR